MKDTEETTDIALSESEENEQVLRIASASLTNIRQNRKTIEEIATKYKGLTIDGVDDKANYKVVSAGITATRTARTTIAKLTKAEKGYLKKTAELLDQEGELLIALVSPVENELKAEKDRIDTLKEEAEQERLRLLEEQKQSRIAKLFELGLIFNGGYYRIGELTITAVQITQFTEAQFEGFVSQATVEFEAIQLKQAEEKAEQERLAEEQLKQQQELAKENQAKQVELDEQSALMKQMLEERTDVRVQQLKSKSFIEVSMRNCYEYRDFVINKAFIETANKADWEAKLVAADEYIEKHNNRKETIVFTSVTEGFIPVNQPINGNYVAGIDPYDKGETFTEPEKTAILDKVFGTSEFEPAVDYTQTVELKFTKANPFIDAKVGKSILRIYTEQFLDEANEGLTKEMVATTGEISNELLFLVIKAKV